MDNAKKHYSSLFSLPSYQRSLVSIAGLCIIGVTLTACAFFPPLNSLILGISLFIITLLTDSLLSKVILRNDPIFIIRRTSGMSFACWLLWLAFAALGAILGFLGFGWLLWVKLTLIGFAATLTLRTLVLSATSTTTKPRQIASAIFGPVLCIGAFFVFWVTLAGNITLQFLPFIILSPIISYAAVYLLLRSIDRLGKSGYNLPAMSLFRAFLLNWVTDLNAPLEAHLEAMGENSDIHVSILKFDSSKLKAAIIMPLVHPGPFKNIGSSLLPSMLKHDFDKAYNCDSCTPLGILGHELDLASQEQNRKIVAEVLSRAKFKAESANASPYVRATDGAAIASCQIFGDTVFLSFSLAPRTTEDLPQELGRFVEEEAKKYGLTHAVVANAHNCLTPVMDTAEHVDELKRAAAKCLKAAFELPKKPFKVGSATVYPSDFTQKQGMGTGGITTIAIEVEGQKTAYVVIDGNNMIPHLREKILDTLAALGFKDGEVLTTDTHAVSALSTGSQGYHPVGEAMNHEVLIKHISDAAKTAATNLEASKAGCIQFIVPNIRVIGEERLDAISTLVDKAITKAKHVVAPIFGVEGLLLILLLLLF
ncbi:MAG: DUF2070 family protein [Candidatus Bathyarchaeia archaeon]|jgi:putative membrane protein